MTKSATRVAADEVSAPIASPVFTGNVGVGNASPAKPLDVTGDIRTSTGILFGTDTAAANTLDDYEEGTYTPAILSAGSACNATVSHVGGAYTKIGRLVTASIRLRTTDNGTATGQLGISLPFAVGDNISTTGLEGAACLAMVTGVTAAHTDLYAAPNEGTSAIRFDFKTSSTSNLTNQLGVHQTANIFDCRVTITYMT